MFTLNSYSNSVPNSHSDSFIISSDCLCIWSYQCSHLWNEHKLSLHQLLTWITSAARYGLELMPSTGRGQVLPSLPRDWRKLWNHTAHRSEILCSRRDVSSWPELARNTQSRSLVCLPARPLNHLFEGSKTSHGILRIDNNLFRSFEMLSYSSGMIREHKLRERPMNFECFEKGTSKQESEKLQVDRFRSARSGWPGSASHQFTWKRPDTSGYCCCWSNGTHSR